MSILDFATMKCFFNGCANDCVAGSFKCLFHIHRGKCSFQDECRHQVYARNLCVRHGGKKQCEFDGCTINSRIGSFCTKHGPVHLIRTCFHDGCSNQAHLRGKCFRHGGSRFCKVDGCVTYARNRGYCTRHTLGNTAVSCEHATNGSAHLGDDQPVVDTTAWDAAAFDAILDVVAACTMEWPIEATCSRLNRNGSPVSRRLG